MPTKSPQQQRFMAAVANNPSFAKRVGVDRKVGEEFLRADRKQKAIMRGKSSTKAGILRPNTSHGKLDMPFHSVKRKAEGGEMKESKAMMKKEVNFMKKKGAPKAMLKHEMGEMKREGRGMAKADMQKGYRTGGYVRSADGIAQRGKTKGKMLRKGGSCK